MDAANVLERALADDHQNTNIRYHIILIHIYIAT